MSISVRTETMALTMMMVSELQERHGTESNIEIMQGLAVALTAFASKQGG